MENCKYPLIIVFYLDSELMKTPEIIRPFAESINETIHKNHYNAIAFFLPTTGEERVECINPVITNEVEMEKINKLISDIKISFSIGVDINIPDEEIVLDESPILEEKPCECGKNQDGSCQCN